MLVGSPSRRRNGRTGGGRRPPILRAIAVAGRYAMPHRDGGVRGRPSGPGVNFCSCLVCCNPRPCLHGPTLNNYGIRPLMPVFGAGAVSIGRRQCSISRHLACGICLAPLPRGTPQRDRVGYVRLALRRDRRRGHCLDADLGSHGPSPFVEAQWMRERGSAPHGLMVGPRLPSGHALTPPT